VKAYFVQDYGGNAGQPIAEVARTWRLPLHKIVISRWLANLVRDHCGDMRIDYVPNAVDHEQFHASPRGKQAHPTVGFLYNPAPQKGCDIILEAIRLVRRSVPDLRVIAYGPDHPHDALPVPRWVDYRHFPADHELRNIYGACDAWLFASRSEGFGLPILEAMACRTPVIGTPAGAAPDLLASGGGLLVRGNDANAMANAIAQIAAMPEPQWKAMSESAHETAAAYTWDEATSLYEAALRRAVQQSSPAAMAMS
jgi:glycosyltransferase involved in cell wall biosynthesis